MESGVWRSGVGEWECGEAQGMSSGMSPELDTESGTGRDNQPLTHITVTDGQVITVSG